MDVFVLAAGDFVVDLPAAACSRSGSPPAPYQTLISGPLHKYASGRLKEI